MLNLQETRNAKAVIKTLNNCNGKVHLVVNDSMQCHVKFHDEGYGKGTVTAYKFLSRHARHV